MLAAGCEISASTTINSFSKDVDTEAASNQQPTIQAAPQVV